MWKVLLAHTTNSLVPPCVNCRGHAQTVVGGSRFGAMWHGGLAWARTGSGPALRAALSDIKCAWLVCSLW